MKESQLRWVLRVWLMLFEKRLDKEIVTKNRFIQVWLMHFAFLFDLFFQNTLIVCVCVFFGWHPPHVLSFVWNGAFAVYAPCIVCTAHYILALFNSSTSFIYYSILTTACCYCVQFASYLLRYIFYMFSNFAWFALFWMSFDSRTNDISERRPLNEV